MKPIKVRGLVLREYEAGESDKRLMIFCKGQGRLMVYARGARKPSSKFLAAAQLFTYADFVLTQGRGFYALAQVEIIENFYALREDYDRLMCAHMVAEVCEKTLWDNIESDELLLLALKTLSVLAKAQVLPLQVSSVFLMRFFDVHGLRPQTEACVVCEAEFEEGLGAVLCAEGLVCNAHRPVVYQPLSAVAIFALRHILDSELGQAFLFTVKEDILKELGRAAKLLWNIHFERELITGF